jgi:hypothetical protein
MLPDSSYSATGILLPKKGVVTKAPLHRDLPCYTIVVHGVNDVGECYGAIERGLCDGLNERLNRGDLRPADYSVPTAQDLQEAAPNPDEAYYHRKPVTGTWSPVIPFYWGFREEELEVDKHERHGEWLDRFGNRLDKNRSKGGGPFSNATHCIPDMFGSGFKEHTDGLSKDKLSQAEGGSPTHPLLDCPSRDYNVLAAKRLAMLITIIRNRHQDNKLPEPTINVIAHSQGNMVTLLAHAILAKEGKRGADGFLMCNATYSLRSMDDWRAYATKIGEPLQTQDARLATFKNILKFMTENPVQAPNFDVISTKVRDSCGLAGEKWRQAAVVKGKEHRYADRDNRGLVHLYFCPEDLTVALPNIQGIGWCGVPDEHLKQMPPGFRQRVWTMRWRDQQPYRVGQGPYSHPLLLKDEKFWKWAEDGFRATVEENTWRWINGDKLPVPFESQLRNGEVNAIEDGKTGHQGSLRNGPLDASVAVSHGGIEVLPPRAVPDPRTDRVPIPATDATGFTSTLKQEQLTWLQDYYDKAYVKHRPDGSEDPSDQFDVKDAWTLPDGTLMLTRTETPNEARKRWQKVAERNSYHSAIVTNHEHHRQATAYDIAVGIGSGSAKTWMKEREADDRAFLDYLCAVGDWRIKETKIKQVLHPLTYYQKESDADFKRLIGATIHYYSTGDLPRHLLPKLDDLLPIVVHETTDEQKKRIKGYTQKSESEGKVIKKGWPL